jgi:hypothetical protein
MAKDSSFTDKKDSRLEFTVTHDPTRLSTIQHQTINVPQAFQENSLKPPA